ncbi:uncharacterized protein [Antedon mediterranea]|uniref:uncharacterized protein n=1 Tax=Antedon mediterranea TaxID=105859 RepID=UPI003AF42827
MMAADQELMHRVKQEMETDTNGVAIPEERGTVIWNYVLTNRLIELWQEQPFLYDINNVYYKDKIVKANALEDIANKMGITVEDVKAKIKGVRSQFVREKKRLRDCTEDDPKPKWPHYSKLTFLENFISAKPGTTNKKDHNEEDKEWMEYEDAPHDYFGNKEYQTQPQPVVEQYVEPQPLPQTPPPPPPPPQPQPVASQLPYSNSPRLSKRPKRKTNESAIVRRYLSMIDKVNRPSNNNVNGNCNNQEIATKTDDDDEIFAKYIATELRTIPDPHVKRSVKLQIHQAIFKAHSITSIPQTSSQPSHPKRRKNYATANHSDGQHGNYYPMNDEDLASTSFSVPSLFTDRVSPNVHMSMGNGEV